MKKIKVLIVDDSPLFRRFVIEGLKKYEYIEIVGYAVDPVDAETKIRLLKPDVVSSDVEMPRMDGISFVKKLMAEHPIRVIVCSSLNISVFDAMSAGAVDFVKKPQGGSSDANQQFLDDLADKILIASQAKLGHQPPEGTSASPRQAGALTSPEPVQSKPAGTPGTPANTSSLPSEGDRLNLSFKAQSTVIAIGASTGGTEAVLDVVKNLPENTPGIVIVQHMPAGFTRMYAERLNKICRMEVREAKDGDKIQKGLILLAPGDFQMTVVKDGNGYSVRCAQGSKVSGHRPSVDVLFGSVAETACPNAIGVILTGMGGDGAKGMLDMRKAGAHTIGQDEASCVVYGMPMVAYNMGAVIQQAPLDKIAGLILNQLSRI